MTSEQELHAPLAIRLPKADVKRLDKLAEQVSRPGMRATRADALRIALCRGLDELEAEKKKR